MKSSLLYVQSLGRGARLSQYADDCVVVDFGRNIPRHGAVDMVTPPTRRVKKGGSSEPVEPKDEALEVMPRQVGADLSQMTSTGALISKIDRAAWFRIVGPPMYLVGKFLWIVPTERGKVRWFSPNYPQDAVHIYAVYDARHGWVGKVAVNKAGDLTQV